MPKLPKLGNLCELIDDGLRRIPQPDKCVFCINVKWGSILFVLMELVRISKHPVHTRIGRTKDCTVRAHLVCPTTLGFLGKY